MVQLGRLSGELSSPHQAQEATLRALAELAERRGLRDEAAELRSMAQAAATAADGGP